MYALGHPRPAGDCALRRRMGNLDQDPCVARALQTASTATRASDRIIGDGSEPGNAAVGTRPAQLVSHALHRTSSSPSTHVFHASSASTAPIQVSPHSITSYSDCSARCDDVHRTVASNTAQQYAPLSPVRSLHLPVPLSRGHQCGTSQANLGSPPTHRPAPDKPTRNMNVKEGSSSCGVDAEPVMTRARSCTRQLERALAHTDQL